MCLCPLLQEEVGEQDSDKITPYKSELEYLDDHFQVREKEEKEMEGEEEEDMLFELYIIFLKLIRFLL